MDRSRLLEGEDPNTADAGDARHWASIYDQLIGFKRRLLARVEEERVQLAAPAQADIEGDVDSLRAQLRRYELRLDFWYERQWALAGVVIDEESRTLTHRGQSVSMTRREFQLVQQLLSHAGHTFTARQLLRDAWGKPELSQEQLRMYVARLRAKLDKLGLAAIVNRPGRGYSLVFSDGVERPQANRLPALAPEARARSAGGRAGA